MPVVKPLTIAVDVVLRIQPGQDLVEEIDDLVIATTSGKLGDPNILMELIVGSLNVGFEVVDVCSLVVPDVV